MTIPSGATPLDLLLHGGLMPGSLTEIFGPPASGKSSLALSFASQASRLGLVTALLDAEEAFSPALAKRFGIDPDRLLLIKSKPHSRALDIAATLLDSSAISLLVIDSVAAISAPEEAHKWGPTASASTSGLLRDSLANIQGIAARNGTFVILINQTRTAQDSANSPVEVAAAGGIHRFCQNRIRLEPEPVVPCNSPADSIPVRCSLLKHRGSFFSTECTIPLSFHGGFDTPEALVAHAIRLGIIIPADLGLWLDDHLIGRDFRDAVRQTAGSPFLDTLIRRAILALPAQNNTGHITP